MENYDEINAVEIENNEIETEATESFMDSVEDLGTGAKVGIAAAAAGVIAGAVYGGIKLGKKIKSNVEAKKAAKANGKKPKQEKEKKPKKETKLGVFIETGKEAVKAKFGKKPE